MKLADLHIHTDCISGKKWHGSKPEDVVHAALNTELDIIAITEHSHNLHEKSFSRFFEVHEYIEEAEIILNNQRKKLEPLMGMEINVSFEGQNYHVGYLFEETYKAKNTPYVPNSGIDLRELSEDYRKEYPGVLIANHISWRDHAPGRKTSVNTALLESGLVDGMEIINAATLLNPGHPGLRSGTEMTKRNIIQYLQSKKEVASIGCSDDHNANLIGTAATAFPENVSLFEAIRENQTLAVGMGDRMRQKIRSIVSLNPFAREYLKSA